VGGIGEILSQPIVLPQLSAVLVNPGRPLATAAVFAQYSRFAELRPRVESSHLDPGRAPRDRADLICMLRKGVNSLETAAISLEPAIASVLTALRTLAGCELARMSGSGATCFGLFESTRSALAAARALRKAHPEWWVRATLLG
jgi:4-diphosphocytidyl-2-C-methyl-D-erythritol kinase